MNILISIVSWLLAAGGFLVSVTTSILAALIPRFQAKVPEEARFRIRIPPRASGEFNEQQQQRSESTLPSTTHAAPGRSSSGSADSLPSFDTAHTTHSDRASTTPTRRTTSTPPTSLPNSPEYRLHALPYTDSTLTRGDSKTHICTPQKCSNHASTSASGAASSSFSPGAEEAGRYRDEADMNPDSKRKTKGTKRMVSWLKTSSPPSSIRSQSQSQSQRTPRSSEDSSRGPIIPGTPPHTQEMSMMNERSATFTDDAHVLLRGSGKSGPSRSREPRRASTLLPFMRFGIGKSSTNRHDVDASASPIPIPIPMLSPTSHMSTVPENLSEGGGEGGQGRKSEPSTPHVFSRDLLPDLESERSMREMKRKSSYFGRLKRKSSGKEASTSRVSVSPPLQDRPFDASSPTQTRFLHPSPQRRDTSTSTSTLSPPPPPPPPPPPHAHAPKKKRSICEKHRRSRPVSAPGHTSASTPTPTTVAAASAAPRRTNPYDAPYYFPTPVSPDAVGYVRRARTEIRRTSVSPSSANGRRRRRRENERGGERESPNPDVEEEKEGELLNSSSLVVQRAKSTSARPHTSTSAGGGGGAPNTILQGAAPQQGSIILPSARTGHRKSASASASASASGTTTATAIRVDEFGFVHPVTVSLREKGNRV